MKKVWLTILIGAGILAASAALMLWLQLQPLLSNTELAPDAQLHLFLGQGGNSLVLLSEDRRQALLVDTKMGAGSARLKRYLDQAAPGASLTIVNTHYHTDHTKGNHLFPNAKLIAGDYTDALWTTQAGTRLPDVRVKAGEELVLAVGSEIAHIRNMGQGHTTNDVVVYLEHRRLLATGDLVFNGWHPVLIRESGTDTRLWTAHLEDLAARYPNATVLPGHGLVAGPEALAAMRDYFASIRAALHDPARQVALEKKYRPYFSPPFMAGFRKTLAFIQAEEKK